MSGTAARTLLVLAAAAMASTPASAALKGVPPQLRRDLACMERVAKTTPGIDRIVTGAERGVDQFVVYEGAPPDTAVWRSPYIEYRITRHGQTATIHFSTERSKRRHDDGYDYGFMTVLGGMSSDGHPNDWGTSALMKEWKTRCDIDVNGLYE
jgi:hypothetical protein